MSHQPLTIFNLDTAIDQSMADTFTTSGQRLDECNGFCYQMYWTSGSSPVGTITLQCSNFDIDSTYVDIPDSATAISGDSGSVVLNVPSPKYQYVRLRYTRASGDGTAQCKLSGKRT